jgi:hypothetical protein
LWVAKRPTELDKPNKKQVTETIVRDMPKNQSQR